MKTRSELAKRTSVRDCKLFETEISLSLLVWHSFWVSMSSVEMSLCVVEFLIQRVIGRVGMWNIWPVETIDLIRSVWLAKEKLLLLMRGLLKLSLRWMSHAHQVSMRPLRKQEGWMNWLTLISIWSLHQNCCWNSSIKFGQHVHLWRLL